MDATFDWDPDKERDNIAKHGVDFRTTARVFEDLALVRAEAVRIIGAGYWRKGREFDEEANRLHR